MKFKIHWILLDYISVSLDFSSKNFGRNLMPPPAQTPDVSAHIAILRVSLLFLLTLTLTHLLRRIVGLLICFSGFPLAFDPLLLGEGELPALEHLKLAVLMVLLVLRRTRLPHFEDCWRMVSGYQFF